MRPMFLRCTLACVTVPIFALAVACGDSKTDSGTAAKGGSDNPGGDSNSLVDAASGCVAPTDADFAAFQTAVGGPMTIDPCSETMLDVYKAEGFAAVTNGIVTRSLDPNNVAIVGSSFQDKLVNASIERQTQFIGHLKLFLEQVYSKDKTLYPADAPDMVTAHRPLNITFAQYGAFATKIVVPALQEAGVSADHINKCFVPPVLADATVRSMVFCK